MSETTKELERLVRDALSEHEDGCSWGLTPPSPCPVCDKQALAEIRLYAIAPALTAEVLAGRKALAQAWTALRDALTLANNRWAEWGDRAVATEAQVRTALDALEVPHE